MNRCLLACLIALMAWLPLAGAMHGAHAHTSIAQCTSADSADTSCPASSCTLCVAVAALGAALASPSANAPLLAARPPLLAAFKRVVAVPDWLAPSSRDPPLLNA